MSYYKYLSIYYTSTFFDKFLLEGLMPQFYNILGSHFLLTSSFKFRCTRIKAENSLLVLVRSD